MKDIYEGRAEWSKLFEEVNFFTRYKHFICELFSEFIFGTLTCAARTEEDHLIFCGFVESKIRHLIGALERNQGISLAHINPRQYKPLPTAVPSIRNPVCTLWFIGLEFDRAMAKAFDLTVEISQFHHIIVTTGIKMKNYNDGMKVMDRISDVDVKAGEDNKIGDVQHRPVFGVGGEEVKKYTGKYTVLMGFFRLGDDKNVLEVSPLTRKRSTDADITCDIPSKKLLLKSDNGLPVIASDS
ncbi:Poly(A) polymerase predicted RNA binding domain protein, partial [Ostertagia ostertagi]